MASSELTSTVGRMEAEHWSSSSGGESDPEACFEDSKDEDFLYETGSLIKLQFRKEVLRACWRDHMGMAEITEHKGRMLTSIGIVRRANIYCSIEETLFLAEIGALLLVDDKGTTIPLKENYEKVAQGKSGCSWEGFEVYRHLKSLGYIVGRHGVPWSLKVLRSGLMCPEDNSEKDNTQQTVLDENSMLQLLNDLHLTEPKPVYEVYLPNSKFRKTCPGDPSFVVYLARGHPPSRSEIEEVEKECNNIPLKIGHVEHGRGNLSR